MSFSTKPSGNLRLPIILSWQWLVQFRRTLHMYPEPSFEEFVTSEMVKNALINQAGIDPKRIRCHLGKTDEDDRSGTGIIVDIMGEEEVQKFNPLGGSKKLIMFRADLDALRMQEENTEEIIPYRSTQSNCAHMCGHDGHIAALIGLAIILNQSSFKKWIPRNVGLRLVFQPAEECIGGAVPMIQYANCLQDVDEVYGWHNWPLVDLGTVLLKEGTVMAHETQFYITVKGKGGHASAPDKCIDPLLCACSIVTNLQTILSRCLPSNTNAVLSVTQFHCGPLNLSCLTSSVTEKPSKEDPDDFMASVLQRSATNVIADQCYLSGTIRDCDRDATFLEIVNHMHRIIKSVSEAHRCVGELNLVEEYIETRNSKECVDIARKCINNNPVTKMDSEDEKDETKAERMFSTNISKVTSDGLPLMGSEDFAYYLKERPGCFVIFGTHQEDIISLANLTFDLRRAKQDISLAKMGAELYKASAVKKRGCKHEQQNGCLIDKAEVESRDQPEISSCSTHRLESKEKTQDVKRTNCCAHGSTFDFNDNVLPRIISFFLNIASERLISEPSKQILFKQSLIILENGVYVANDTR